MAGKRGANPIKAAAKAQRLAAAEEKAHVPEGEAAGRHKLSAACLHGDERCCVCCTELLQALSEGLWCFCSTASADKLGNKPNTSDMKNHSKYLALAVWQGIELQVRPNRLQALCASSKPPHCCRLIHTLSHVKAHTTCTIK